MKGTDAVIPYGMRRSDNPAFVGGSFSTSLPTITELSLDGATPRSDADRCWQHSSSSLIVQIEIGNRC